jgi:hypothetical protein
MNEPKEPHCPAGKVPHRERVREIDARLPEGKSGGVCIDNTPEHTTWYLHEIGKYPRLVVEFKGVLSKDVYLIRVRKVPQN